MNTRFGNEVRSERKNLGLSQTELAALCGVSKVVISKIESNEYTPSVTVAFCFELLFQKPLGDILPSLTIHAKENLFGRLISLTNTLDGQEEREWTHTELTARAGYLATGYEEE